MWTGSEIVQATNGAFQGDIKAISSVSIDSRTLEQGSLFVALKGERVDGHDYVKAALANGAAAALVSEISSGMVKNAPLIQVQDTYKALVALAKAARRRTRGKIIAVTGSVGKTSTKEAIRLAVSTAGSVYATRGNLNNHIGLPLSLANLPAETKFGVFELGMNHAGEISYLTKILQPDIAMITNVGAAHLEFFESVEKIADAKAEIMEGLDRNGTIILNRDNDFYEHLLNKTHAHGIKNILTFGEHFEADCRLANYIPQNFGSQVEAIINRMPITYHIGTIGHHWALTSLAALAAITAAGADLADAAAALSNFQEPEGRGRVRIIPLPQGAITLIDDCYNASPNSMNAALSKLAELYSTTKSEGRKIAVLGDMLELGSSSIDLHKALLAPLQNHAIDKLYAVGQHMKTLYDITPAKMQGAYAASAKEIADKMIHDLRPHDIVLIKGSHGSRMDIVRDAITNQKELADAI